MLKAEQLQEMAEIAGNRASKYLTDSKDFSLPNYALIECAIYTVGAEIVGRLDNLHFDVDGVNKDVNTEDHAAGPGFTGQTVHLTGRFWTKRRQDDKRDTEADSDADTAGAKTAGS